MINTISSICSRDFLTLELKESNSWFLRIWKSSTSFFFKLDPSNIDVLVFLSNLYHIPYNSHNFLCFIACTCKSFFHLIIHWTNNKFNSDTNYHHFINNTSYKGIVVDRSELLTNNFYLNIQVLIVFNFVFSSCTSYSYALHYAWLISHLYWNINQWSTY